MRHARRGSFAVLFASLCGAAATAGPPRDPFPVPDMTDLPADAAPFRYADVGAKIPNYTPGETWGEQGAPLTEMQLPLSPAESMTRFVVPEGFRLELFAAEPDLGGKPIAVNWDERGRLWVCETVDYPNELQPPGGGRDRVRVCEDTDGDGRADRFTVFAEGLSVPTALGFHRGGVLVQNGTETLFLKDTDGDGRADRREVVFTGWNLRDTHGGVSNFFNGLDNHVWAMQGYNASRPVRPGAEDPDAAPRFAAGFFRFDPDGGPAEFLRSTNNNTWGLGISEEGLAFGSTANGCPSVFLPIPNRYYEAVRGWTPSLVLGSIADDAKFDPIAPHVRQVDHHGGYTAGAGHAIYTARAYPREYWNRVAFVNGPTGHLTGAFVLEPDGAGFRSRSDFNLLASDDGWAAPIVAEVGPDGAVWVVDWYNYIVQHNPTPRGFETGAGQAYETDLRDKTRGRIYRVVHDGAPAAERHTLAGATPGELVAGLTHDNFRWRLHAQRLLVERDDADIAPALLALTRDRSTDEIGLNPGATHALWTLHGLGLLDGSDPDATAAAVACLRHPSAGVRRNAAQVLPAAPESTAAVLAAGLLDDGEPQVRLAGLLALADFPPTADAAAALAAFARDPAAMGDRWLRDATVAAAANNAGAFLRAAAAGGPLPAPAAGVLPVVAEHFARGNPADEAAGLIAALAGADPALAAPIVAGLAAGWPAGAAPALTDELEADLERLVGNLAPADRGRLLRLTAGWGGERLRKYAEQAAAALLARVDDAGAATDARLAAARELVALRPDSPEPVAALLDRVTPQTPPELAAGLVRAAGGSGSDGLGEELAGRLASFTPAVRAAAVGALLARRETAPALLDALESGAVRLADLSLDRQAALSEHPDPAVRRRARDLLARGGAVPDPDRAAVLDRLTPLADRAGDPAAGRRAFEKACAACHRHGSLGKQIGPDLTGMAAHPKAELLVHILDPSRNVESNFRSYTLLTTDGLVLTGMLAGESRTAVELIDAEGKRRPVLREDLLDLTASNKSLMPEGFEKQLTETELTDLLEFLTARGRFLPLDLTGAATAASDRDLFDGPAGSGAGRLVPDEWGVRTINGVPFDLADPRDGARPNVIVLHGPRGRASRAMPKSVALPVAGRARAVHLLGGVSGWGYPFSKEETVSLIVRLRYADGTTEDHPLKNGVHLADYVRRVDVPGSAYALSLGGRQVRTLSIVPGRAEPLAAVEFVKGPDATAPVVLAVTLELEPPAAGE